MQMVFMWMINSIKKLHIGLIALFIVCLSPPSVFGEPKGSKDNAEAVILQLKWFHQFQFAGYYMAVEKGYYKDNGLLVFIKEGGPNTLVDKEVLEGRADYGVLASELIEKRLNGSELVLLAAIMQHSIRALIVRSDSEIYSPADLVGRTTMLNLNEQAEFLEMFKFEGINPKVLIIIQKEKDAVEQLINGNIAAMNGSIANQPFVFKKRGVEVRLIRPITYGIDFYGDSLFTSEAEAGSHPDRVERFISASLQGWGYALDNIDETVHVIWSKYNSAKSKQQLTFEAEVIKKQILPDLVDLGHINPHRIENIAHAYQNLSDTADPSNLRGFIFTPKSASLGKWFTRILIIGVIVACLFTISLVVLFLFNQRLKREVAKQTEQLLSANQELKMEISERKIAELAVRESEERFRQLAENIKEVFWIVSPDWTEVYYISPAYEELWGLSCESLYKSPFGWFDSIVAEDKVAITTFLKEKRGGDLKRIEFPDYWINRPDGSKRCIRARGFGVTDHNGEVYRIAGIAEDITHRKKIEIELKKLNRGLENRVKERTIQLTESNKQLKSEIQFRKLVEEKLVYAKELSEAANAAKSEFLANISHELRNPMHQIINFSKYGVSKFDQAEDSKKLHYFRQINKSASKLMVLLNDLLDLSKLEAGKMEFRKGKFDLKKTVQEVMDEFGPIIEDKHLQLSMDLPREPIVLTYDEFRISQVIRNLISNAVKFTEKNKTIRVGLQKEKTEKSLKRPVEQVNFFIADQGIGIPKDELDSVFDKFTQSSKTKTGAGGTGLGLAICKEIIKEHQGNIWAESLEEKGAVFKVSLPVI